MSLFKALGAVILASALLTGCALLDVNYDEERESAQKQIERGAESRASRSELFNVVYDDKFYAPELREEDHDRPSWYFETTEFNYRSTPFRMVVSDVFGEYASIRFLQSIPVDAPVSLQHKGTLGEAIEKLALSMGFAFDLRDDVLSFYKYENREFDISFIPGLTSYLMGNTGQRRNQQAGGGSAAGFQTISRGNTGGDGSRNSFEGEFDVFDDFTSSVGLLLSPEGSFNINRSTSSLVVRDLPENVRTIEQYVNRQNSSLNQQVAIKVEVIDVTFKNNNQTSINLNLLRESSGASVVSSLVGGGSTSAILSNALGMEVQNGRWAGSQVFIEALKEQGVVEMVTQREILTTNNQVGSINVENSQSYLASVGSNQTVNVGTSDMLIPGEVTTGFSLQVLPRIQGERVLVQISAVISELKNLTEVSDGNRTIQVPNIDKNDFFLRNWLQNEQTLMISGLRSQRSDTRNDQGFMSMLFGGARGTNKQRTETIILVTPTILDAGI